MRCIDGDSLMNTFADRLAKVSERYGVNSAVAGAVAGAMGLIEAQPTIEPERTGKWVEDTEQTHIEKCWYCSKCGYKAWGQYEKTDFCGGCGAKMDGSEQE